MIWCSSSSVVTLAKPAFRSIGLQCLTEERHRRSPRGTNSLAILHVPMSNPADLIIRQALNGQSIRTVAPAGNDPSVGRGAKAWADLHLVVHDHPQECFERRDR